MKTFSNNSLAFGLFAILSVVGANVPLSAARANSTPSAIEAEIPIEGVFAPTQGFDDNDNIQVVIHGNLPNTCYTLGRTATEPTFDSYHVRIRQFVQKRTDGICADEAGLPEHLKMLVPFTKEIPFGQLPVGNYEFDYWKAADKTATRRLNISPATTPTVDSFPYAAVSGIATSDVFSGLDDVEVTLNGVLNSTCTELDQNVKVIRETDVYVLLPVIKVKTGVMCAQVLVPFQKKVNLGRATPGHHLIQVRSMNGQAVNHIVLVTK